MVNFLWFCIALGSLILLIALINRFLRHPKPVPAPTNEHDVAISAHEKSARAVSNALSLLEDELQRAWDEIEKYDAEPPKWLKDRVAFLQGEIAKHAYPVEKTGDHQG